MIRERSAENSATGVAELLGQMAIFADLTDVAVHQLAARCVARDFGAGRVLFTTGDACRGLYVIQSGRVRIYRTSPDGKEQVLHIEGPGLPVAELPLFDGGPYPASAITVEPSRLMFLARDDFEAVYREHPDIAQAIIRALGKRLRHLVHVTETLAFHDVAARLAMLLVGYAERSGIHTQLGIEIKLDRTQEELSMETGSARESVSRAMRQLKRTGLVESLPRGRMRIPSVARLRARAKSDERHANAHVNMT